MGLLIQPVGKSPVITTSKKAEGPAEQTPLSAAEQRKKDRMELSKAALSYVQSVAERQEKILQKQEAQKNKLAQYGDISQQIAQANEQADAQNEQFETMNRCSKIAANVMSGKKVPLKDLQYLMKHDSKLYQMAMVMRRPPKDDKECDSVLKDSDDESSDSASSTDSAASDASAPSSPAAGGSAEAPAPAAEAAPSEGGGAE